MSVEEDETIERVDGDNPDRWVVEAAAPDRCGRLASVCVLDKPVASHYRHTTGKSPREQFRDEVLTISNKQQECLMKRRWANGVWLKSTKFWVPKEEPYHDDSEFYRLICL